MKEHQLKDMVYVTIRVGGELQSGVVLFSKEFQKGNIVKIPRGRLASIKDILKDVVMVLPWDTGHEEIYDTCDLTFVADRKATMFEQSIANAWDGPALAARMMELP